MTARYVAGAAGPPSEKYDADILILALDRIPETLKAIASATSQTGVSLHVFVLDQGSSSDGLNQLAAAGSDRVTVLAAEHNLGVAGGRNLLSGLGHAPILIALDNDAEFSTTDTAARMVAALDAEPHLGAIGCRIVRHCDGADDLTSWGYPAALLPSAAECFDTVTFVGAGHAIRRTAWTQAGGYDPALFFCWEEYDFCLRVIALGWRIRYRGDITIRHKASPEQRINWSGQRWHYFVRNRLYIERKQGRSWLALTPRMCGYLLKGFRNAMATRTMAAIREAATMTPGHQTPTMSRLGLSYVRRNDNAHRESLLHRAIKDSFMRLGVSTNAVSPAE